MAEERVLQIQSISLGEGVSATNEPAFYDGRIDPNGWTATPHGVLENPEDSLHVDADLGAQFDVTRVTIWMWRHSSLRYHSQSVEVSTDGNFDGDTSRVLWSTGSGELGPAASETEGHAVVPDGPARGRYVRVRSGKHPHGNIIRFLGLEVRGREVAEGEDDDEGGGAAGSPPAVTLAPWAGDNYGHAYWPNGHRKPGGDDSADVLCFETGRYGLALNVDDLTAAKFGTFEDGTTRLSYTDALDMSKRERMDALGEESLLIELQVEGKTYRAATCLAGTSNARAKARLWEAGRFVQNYELVGVVFREEGGSEPECSADLIVVVWPESFSLTLKVKPKDGASWTEGANIKMEFGKWSVHKAYTGEWPATKERSTSLDCHVTSSGGEIDGIDIKMSGFKRPDIAVDYLPDFSCYVARLHNPVRLFPGGYVPIRGYDKFKVTVENTSDEEIYIPFLFELKNPAQITGVVPMLVFPDGTPTGIPVQLSKNWHNRAMGNYVRSYALLPAPAGSSQSFELHFVYGFYGALPSASHANLCLVGWGGDGSNGRWEQLAIGCWGETHCIDAELSATGHNVITDVRALMVRVGADGKMWAWTNAGWGGDWLDGFDAENRRIFPRGVKAAYISQGPCLTDVQYGGFYGGHGALNTASFLNTVRTLRTDDYARTFHSLRFNFHGTASFQNRNNGQVCCLFRVGGNAWEKLTTPRIAVGNSDGLIEEYEVPSDLNAKSFFKEEIELEGTGPWWIAYPGMKCRHQPDMGQGWRALVIQSYNVTRGGQSYDNPVVSFFVHHQNDGASANVDTLVRPPKGSNELNEGDSASLDLYWITLPHNADDYYGPNAALKKHLEEKPDSWETVLREVQGNSLDVEVTGGEVKQLYPLIIESTDGSEIHVNVTGGVGAVPMRFEGLDSGLYRLFRSSSEDGECELSPADDSWQVNYDAETFTYSVTYNVVLDEMGSSAWVLKK